MHIFQVNMQFLVRIQSLVRKLSTSEASLPRPHNGVNPHSFSHVGALDDPPSALYSPLFPICVHPCTLGKEIQSMCNLYAECVFLNLGCLSASSCISRCVLTNTIGLINLQIKYGASYFSVAEFHPNIDKLQLFTAAEDYKIRVWDLRTSTCLALLESHYSVITAIQFSLDHTLLYSAGRDNVVTIWDIDTHKKSKTIPVYEVLTVWF